MRTKKQRGSALLAALASLAVAWPASAQDGAEGSSPAVAVGAIVEVASVLDDRSSWRAAASALVADASGRAVGEPEALEWLGTAALIYLHIGYPDTAYELMLEVAEDAAAVGNVVTAAHAQIDAAWLAGAQGRVPEALELAERALMLSGSPLLGDAERSAILVRIVGADARYSATAGF